MATKTATKEYGVLVAPIGASDDSAGKYMSKKTFFAQMELQYPSAAGWYVVDRSVDAGSGESILMAYHLERDVA